MKRVLTLQSLFPTKFVLSAGQILFKVSRLMTLLGSIFPMSFCLTSAPLTAPVVDPDSATLSPIPLYDRQE